MASPVGCSTAKIDQGADNALGLTWATCLLPATCELALGLGTITRRGPRRDSIYPHERSSAERECQLSQLPNSVSVLAGVVLNVSPSRHCQCQSWASREFLHASTTRGITRLGPHRRAQAPQSLKTWIHVLLQKSTAGGAVPVHAGLELLECEEDEDGCLSAEALKNAAHWSAGDGSKRGAIP